MKPNKSQADKWVAVPEFELVGPPCTEPGCAGILVNCMCLKSKKWFRKCNKCDKEYRAIAGTEK